MENNDEMDCIVKYFESSCINNNFISEAGYSPSYK